MEMHKLLLERLESHKAEDRSERRVSVGKGKKWVKGIAAWLQCFAVYVSVVARSLPGIVPELMAYDSKHY